MVNKFQKAYGFNATETLSVSARRLSIAFCLVATVVYGQWNGDARMAQGVCLLVCF
jgi:hypothetical protein